MLAYILLYVCMHVCMYVCMYVYVYIYIYIYIFSGVWITQSANVKHTVEFILKHIVCMCVVQLT